MAIGVKARDEWTAVKSSEDSSEDSSTHKKTYEKTYEKTHRTVVLYDRNEDFSKLEAS
jgi:hypothetical protein